MSSSSDEDEVQLRQIQEATSEQLRFAMKKENKNDEGGSQAKKLSRSTSSRLSNKHDNHFELDTTPEFRCHIAKKLGDHLDRLLKGVEVTSMLPKQDEHGGIRLLSSSTAYATVDDMSHASVIIAKVKLRRKSSPSSSDEDLEKFAAVCVSGQAILDGGEGVFKKNVKVKHAKRKRQKEDKPDLDQVT